MNAGAGFDALAQWRGELTERRRTATTFDVLWRAAVWEMEAEETEGLGLHGLTIEKRRWAAAIVEAAKGGAT